MKKFKFLKMLFLTVGMTAVFNVVNSSAMNNKFMQHGENLIVSFYDFLPNLEDIEEEKGNVLNGYLGVPTVDPQYIVKQEGDKIYYIIDDSIRYYKLKGENFYRDLKGKKYKILPQAEDYFDITYKVLNRHGKTYYLAYNNTVLYEVVNCGDRLSYRFNGKEKFYSIKGKSGYYISFRG